MDIAEYIVKDNGKGKIYKTFHDFISSLDLFFIDDKIYLLYTKSDNLLYYKQNHDAYYFESKNIFNEFDVNKDLFEKNEYSNDEFNKVANINFYKDDNHLIYIRGFIDRPESIDGRSHNDFYNNKYFRFIQQHYGDGFYISKIRKFYQGFRFKGLIDLPTITKENYDFKEYEIPNHPLVAGETRPVLLKKDNTYYLYLRCNQRKGMRHFYCMMSEDLKEWTQPEVCKINDERKYNIYYQNIWLREKKGTYKFYGLFMERHSCGIKNSCLTFLLGKSNNGLDWETKEVYMNNIEKHIFGFIPNDKINEKYKIEIVSGVIHDKKNVKLFFMYDKKIFQIKIPSSKLYDYF